MKIVKEEPKTGKLLKKYSFNVHVESLAKISKNVASRILHAYNGERYFSYNAKNYVEKDNGSLDGKAYITYPLNVVVEIDIKNCRTTGELLWIISRAYKKIYKEENSTSKIKEISSKDRCKRGGLQNRNTTNGSYGIWGHDLRDLYFEGIEIYDNRRIHISMGS